MNDINAALRRALKPKERTVWRASHGLFENAGTEEIARCIRFNDLAHTSSHYTPELCDPIFTPIFTAIFGAGGISLFGTTITYASIASAIATTALTFGLQMLLMKPPKPDKARQPLVQAIPPRFWGVGRTRISGAFWLWEAKKGRIISVQGVCGHPIKSFNSFMLHDDPVTLTGDPASTDGAYVNAQAKDRYGGGRIRIYTRLGAVPETPYTKVVELLGAEDIWTNNHRGDGQASIAMIGVKAKKPENQRKSYPYGPPAVSAIADLALVWDFRDPDQHPEDPTTWQWSRNPALILCWHECFSPFGAKRDFRKAILPVLDMWKEEADVCDEPIPRAIGGTEPRYQCDGQGTADLDPKVGRNAILASMDGWTCDRGDGALLVVAGKFREKYCATLTDEDIVGHDIDYDVLPEDEINRLVPKFNFPATDYTETDTDFWEDTNAVLIAGRPLSRDMELDYVTEWRQARRLGKREFQRLRSKVSGRLDCRLTGFNAAYLPWIRLNAPKRMPRLNGALLSNRRSVLNLLRGGFTIDVTGMPADIDAWTPATDEGMAPPVPPRPDQEENVVPDIDSVTAKVSGNSVYLQVALIDPIDDTLTPVIAWRVKDIGGGTPGAFVQSDHPDLVPASGLILVNTGAVPADTVLQVKAAYRNTDATLGEFTTPLVDVSTTIDTVAPLALTTFAVTGGALHLGHAPLSFTTKNDAHLAQIAIYRVPTGAALNKATHFAVRINALLNTTFAYIDGDDSVTNLYVNPDFASDTIWSKGTGWTIAAGIASKAAGTASGISQNHTSVPPIIVDPGAAYRFHASPMVRSAGSIQARISGGTAVDGTLLSASGRILDRLTALSGNNTLSFRGDASFAGSIDNAVVFKETPSCAPQGDWDYYAIPENRSGVEGPQAMKLDIIVI